MRGAGLEGEGIGAVAQLGEHLLCKQGVTGSIPVSSTSTHEEEGTRERSGASLSSGFFGSWRSPAPREGGGHIGSLKIREVEGGVMDAPGTAFCPGASQHTLGYVLHRALHI